MKGSEKERREREGWLVRSVKKRSGGYKSLAWYIVVVQHLLYIV